MAAAEMVHLRAEGVMYLSAVRLGTMSDCEKLHPTHMLLSSVSFDARADNAKTFLTGHRNNNSLTVTPQTKEWLLIMRLGHAVVNFCVCLSLMENRPRM